MNNVLITGASRGLGIKIAEIQLTRGNAVYGIARTETDQVRDLQSRYENFSFRRVDLAQPDEMKAAIFGDFMPYTTPLHGYVNNAAMAYDDIITNLHTAELEAMFKVNVFSPFMITKYVLRNMLLHKTRGSIVHISSVSAHTGYKGLSMYAATKGALEAFSKNAAREWGQIGIRSNCVVAGFMETNMSASLTDGQKDRIYARTALKAPTDQFAVAEAVDFLLSDSSRSTTGQNIFVDSGTI